MSSDIDYLFEDYSEPQLSTTFPFLELHPELRNCVYEAYMPRHQVIFQGQTHKVAMRINKYGEPVVPALTTVSRWARYETQGYVHSAIQKEGLIHAQVESCDFAPLHKRIADLSKEHNIPESELRSRVVISLIGAPDLDNTLAEVNRLEKFSKDAFIDEPTHFPGYGHVSLWRGSISLPHFVNQYSYFKGIGAISTWRTIAKKLLQTIEENFTLDVSIKANDSDYQLLQQLFTAVVKSHQLFHLNKRAIESDYRRACQLKSELFDLAETLFACVDEMDRNQRSIVT